MKILIVGGSGHIGSYLVPRLIRRGFDVTVISRNCRPRYAGIEAEWRSVNWMRADRKEEEKNGDWEKRMGATEADAVVDLICFTPDQNEVMIRAFSGRVSHFLHCGTLWAYGPAYEAPCSEECTRRPVTGYGRLKADIEARLLQAFRENGFPSTILHPGHISGRKWLPIDPQGSLNGTGIYESLASGREVYLPDNGLATLHHVHADDVAQLFEKALLNRNAAAGRSFSVAAPQAVTLAGCCTSVAGMFGRDPVMKFVPLADLAEHMPDTAYQVVKTHVEHSPCASIEKARNMLGFEPRYTTTQIYRECIEYMLDKGTLSDPG